MKLTSAGAARTVTGSCHHFEVGGLSALVDCGLFQGGADLDALNHRPFPFEPAALDIVLVTHGHLDHVGRLPLLVKGGYGGSLLATQATIEVAGIILRDSAKLQEEDYKRALRKARRAGRESELRSPLYTAADVEETLKRFRPVELDVKVPLDDKVSATFRPAGHILGSTYIEVTTPDLRVTFSGDLGNRESTIQAPAAKPNACDVLIMESTYADTVHPSRTDTEAHFLAVLERSLKRGGNVMIPTFATERAQQVLYLVDRYMTAGTVPSVPVYLDSPMAARMTRLYQSCAHEFRPEIMKELAAGEDPFAPPTLTFTVTAEESKQINEHTGGAVIIAGSGMMTGGRIQHHLKHNLWREEASLVIVGYQGVGTLGRTLLDGAERVRIFGEEIAVRAKVENIKGFSAHADHDDLMAYLGAAQPRRLYLVHGEPEVMDAFAAKLNADGLRTATPERDVPIEL